MKTVRTPRRVSFPVALAALVAFAALSGCAGIQTVSSDVASYGEWPAARKPGTYAFERLPSQAAMARESDSLEAAAAPALAKAGFVVAAPGQNPDVLVQVGARTQLTVDRRWDDRLWWGAGFGSSFGYWRRGSWIGPSPYWTIGWRSDFPRYDREVGVLIRDRVSSKPIFEARASNEGHSRTGAELQTAMFEAALVDFPKLGINPRRVVVAVPSGASSK